MTEEILKAIERVESKLDQLIGRGGKPISGDGKSQCNKCGADVEWHKTFKGKSVAINPGKSPSGDWKVVNGVAGKYNEQHDAPETPRYTCHFDTCGRGKPNIPDDVAEQSEVDLPF